MRDGIILHQAGHPVVVLVHDFFERAARTQAQALGLPELKIYVYPQYKPGEPDAVEEAKAARAAEELPQMLEQPRESWPQEQEMRVYDF